MYLKNLSLSNFRSYEQSSFSFSEDSTLIVGPNTSGKTNLVEAIFLLSTGKSSRSDKELQAIRFGHDLARIKAQVGENELEIVLTVGEIEGKKVPFKKFFVNGVSKRRQDFVGNLNSVLFSPLDLEIIIGPPGLRRALLDNILEQVDLDYRVAITEYEKGLRQRNSLLDLARKTGNRDLKQFEYWDNNLIKNGSVVSAKREKFIAFLNSQEKAIFDFAVIYDKSVISSERLSQYHQEEFYAGVTLVGPHRDDISFQMYDNERQTTHNVKHFGSRGQQRLAILQIKMLELTFLEKSKGERPLFLLDDVFSELDEAHINHVLDTIGKQQTIITTTHKEFIPKEIINKMEVIELKK